jgi:acyl-CoA thioester hydrolase
VSWAYTHTERIRFGDLDAMRHLNNVVFLRYFETARISYLNSLFDSHDPVKPVSLPRPRELGQDSDVTFGFGFIFASCHIDYRSPGHFDEEVAISVRPSDIGTKSLKLEFEMRVEDRLLAEGYGVLVGYDYETQRSAPIPDALCAKLRTNAHKRNRDD